MMQPTFGAKLRALRQASGKSQKLVAAELAGQYPRLHISQSTISNLERRTDTPRKVVLRALATYYQVDPTYLVNGANGSLDDDEYRLLTAYRQRAWATLLRLVGDAMERRS